MISCIFVDRERWYIFREQINKVDRKCSLFLLDFPWCICLIKNPFSRLFLVRPFTLCRYRPCKYYLVGAYNAVRSYRADEGLLWLRPVAKTVFKQRRQSIIERRHAVNWVSIYVHADQIDCAARRVCQPLYLSWLNLRLIRAIRHLFSPAYFVLRAADITYLAPASL